jgi:UDP-N-acetylmuramoyl-tripeptide--D-alanyl-D-alanine ligase
MLELGENAAALHREVGAFAAERVDLVITCGDLARQIAEGAGRGTRCLHFDAKDELLAALHSFVVQGDYVLVKASRGMHFEEITRQLVEL